MEKIIFHIDVNSAFLSWEAINRIKNNESDLREIPSIIGASRDGNRGIVLAKSIPAKKFGIETAEPIYSALRKCPSLVVVPPSFSIYHYFSQKLVQLLEETFPVIEQYSIDECFVDYTGMETILGEPIQVAYSLKERIKNELGFTVNIGVSVNKLLAKMASDLEKPDKVHTLFPEEIRSKMWPLPISNLFMVGKATSEKLKRIGVGTIGDLAQSPQNMIERIFKKHGSLIWQYANGIDFSKVNPGSHSELSSISNETTLYTNITDKSAAHKVIISLAEKVTMRLRQATKYCQVVSIIIKDSDFHSYSRQRKLSTATNCTQNIIQVAKELFDEVWKGEAIRLLGVGVTHLSSEALEQMSFFTEMQNEKQNALDKSMDEIRNRFGYGAISRSSLFKEKGN